MMKHTLAVLAIGLIPTCVYAVDGQVLINQATVIATGGFPYKITQPGSYKLSGNLVVTALNVNGIDINSDNVNLDLNGFTVTGPVVCTGNPPVCSVGFGLADGIHSLNNNLAVKNGAIRGFFRGVAFFGQGLLVTDLLATGNSSTGFFSTGGATVIARCVANGNEQEGIRASLATISDSIANFNGGSGFIVDVSTVIHNTAVGNGLFGIKSSASIYGSNTFVSNGSGDVIGDSSQGNNRCTSGVC